ncbi:hypothetical protein AB3N60_01975 [Leptospira sp. WS39.C2]
MKKITYFIIFAVISSIVYTNPIQWRTLKSIGFSMQIPMTWSDVSEEEFHDNLQRVKFESATFTKLIRENKEIPLISLRRGDSDSEEFLTTINVKLQANNLEFRNIPNTLRKLLFYVSLQLKNFDYLIEPKTVRINGKLAGYSLFSYKMINENGDEKKVFSAIWIFPFKEYYYFIGTAIPHDDFEPILEEIKTIINTVKIDSK